MLGELELARAAQKAVALAQQDKSAWTRADLIKHLGRVLPRTGIDPAAAAALREDLADRALVSEFEPVTCLEAPEPAEVPHSSLRAHGRSVYQRHGGTRYATRPPVHETSYGHAERVAARTAPATRNCLSTLNQSRVRPGRILELEEFSPTHVQGRRCAALGCWPGALESPYQSRRTSPV